MDFWNSFAGSSEAQSSESELAEIKIGLINLKITTKREIPLNSHKNLIKYDTEDPLEQVKEEHQYQLEITKLNHHYVSEIIDIVSTKLLILVALWFSYKIALKIFSKDFIGFRFLLSIDLGFNFEIFVSSNRMQFRSGRQHIQGAKQVREETVFSSSWIFGLYAIAMVSLMLSAYFIYIINNQYAINKWY